MHPQTTLLVTHASMDSSMRWVAVVVPLRCVALRWLFRWLRCVGGSVALVNFVGCVALVVPLRWLPSGMLRVRSIALAQPQTTGQPADLNDHAGGVSRRPVLRRAPPFRALLVGNPAHRSLQVRPAAPTRTEMQWTQVCVSCQVRGTCSGMHRGTAAAGCWRSGRRQSSPTVASRVGCGR